jgi:hypothetical protein
MVETFFWEDLDRQNANPYESVIGAAREARKINAQRRGKIEDLATKPTTIALKRLTVGEVRIQYLSSREIAAIEEAHASEIRTEDKKDPAGSDRGDRGL